MSGRDLRSFVTTRRADDAASLVHRAKAGLASCKYKEVDYAALKALAAEKRKQGQEAVSKMKKIEDASKQRKQQTLVRQHKVVWQKEFSRLTSARKRLESEIELHHNESLVDDMTGETFEKFEKYRDNLQSDLMDFKKNTAEPIWNLRNDLKVWIEKMLSEDPDENVELEDPNEVKEIIESIRQQQCEIMERLQAERNKLEAQIDIVGLIDSNIVAADRTVETGIPEEAFNLECPDLKLKASVLQEFILIDGKYVEKLNEMEEEYQEVLSLMFGGWSERDHSIFIYVNDQYSAHEIENRRFLYIDFLMKLLPHKTRNNIVDHEDWWTRCRYFYQRRRDLLIDWTRDRTELFNRSANVFNEACMARLMQEQKLEDKQKQEEYCDALYAKVQKWREQKMEAMRLGAEVAEERRRAMAAKLAEEDEKQKQKLKEQKMKIQHFHNNLEAKRLERAIQSRKRLEELEHFLAEQAIYDRERVKFREDEYIKKEDEKMKKLFEKQALEAQKEEVLEAIRQKVRPHVEFDLLRLWSNTIAWQEKHKPEVDVHPLQPLYNVKGFTTEQILADPRCRLELRLFSAGLQGTTYARDAIASMKPLHPPRRDMESTVFKNS